MCMGGLEHIRQVLRHVETAADEARTRTEREGGWTGGMIVTADGGRRRLGPFPAGRRSLTLGKTIDFVIEQHDLHVHVSAKNMHQVIAADRQSIAVTGHQPDIEIRISQFRAGRKSGCTAVDGVEAVALDVIGETAGAADAGNEHGVRRVRAKLRQCALHGLEDRIVPATRAPADFLIGFPILERGFDLYRSVHSAPPSGLGNWSSLTRT